MSSPLHHASSPGPSLRGRGLGMRLYSHIPTHIFLSLPSLSPPPLPPSHTRTHTRTHTCTHIHIHTPSHYPTRTQYHLQYTSPSQKTVSTRLLTTHTITPTSLRGPQSLMRQTTQELRLVASSTIIYHHLPSSTIIRYHIPFTVCQSLAYTHKHACTGVK